MDPTVRVLRDRGLLVLGTSTGAAVVTQQGWEQLPEPLASYVRAAVSADDMTEG